ncbi:diadenylate cyclase CdaA [Clostridium sp.]|uniref:diadenylate cyclase CdaA n=1 Tax=Clostridium sp. TaxID=1506 RepID=UPI0025C2B6DF|nr:diadenylate cyclase CdaA [Clostridium sp.]
MLKDVLNQLFDYLQIISYVNFRNVIDILLLTLLFYSILKPMRRTKGEVAIKGLILIIISMKLSDILGLTGTNWIIERVINYGVISIIVIFQPEIRKLIENFGNKSIFSFRKNSNSEIDNVISILSKSVEKLSFSKTGALIIIEKSIPLTDFLVNSTPLDAILTENLLCNIFIDGSPLHDGAIIIENSRVKAANCVLPLSNKILPVEYGTRHRAALGISDITDAVVVVVSEETGKISICSAGEIKRYSDKVSFINALNNLLKDNDNNNSSQGGKGWLKKTLKMKS